MAVLMLPQAIPFDDIAGGYNSKALYTMLKDNETNDARNIEVTDNLTLKKRMGYERLYSTALASQTAGAGQLAITGHFQFVKTLGTTVTKRHIVGSGPKLYDYTSSSLMTIATGLTSNEHAYWSFVQIQDPRSASNDVVVMTNGSDPILMWDGTENSAVRLDAQTSSTGVPICKYLLNCKNRIYGLNVVDATDKDASCKVVISGFADTGAPRPQRFEDFFYVGGSDEYGEIRGGCVLNDQIIIFKRNATYKFTPGSAKVLDASSLVMMDGKIGCIAPRSIQTDGNSVYFLSEVGVYKFDGNTFTYIGQNAEKDFDGSDKLYIQYACGYFWKQKNNYWIAYPQAGETHNNRIMIYHTDMHFWYPPYTGIYAHLLSGFRDTLDKEFPIIGDFYSYLYKFGDNFADGIQTGWFGGCVSATLNVVTVSATGNLPITGDGMRGLTFRIIDGSGQYQESIITGNTINTVTLEDALGSINSTSLWTIGGIDASYRTKDFSFSAPDVDKKFVKTFVRTSQEGHFNMTLQYIIDFRTVTAATTRQITLDSNGFTWDASLWDMAYWGGSKSQRNVVPFRATPLQSLTGKYLALRFYNAYPNQPFEIFGWDIILKAVGRR